MKFFKPTLVALALVAAVGCQEKAQEDVSKAPVLETEIQKQAYALGTFIGQNMKRNFEEQEKLGLGFDAKLVIQGFEDSLTGTPAIEQEDARALLMAFEATAKAKQQEVMTAEAETNIAAGTKFLEENAKKEGVQVTESGIQYVVLKEGQGEKPAATDTVKVHYKGTLISGESFDSSYDRGQPAVFPLNRVIPGWTEGVQLMSVGAKYKFTIPSDLAYGPNGKPPTIPGNSVLEFEIELLEIQKPEAPAEVGE